MKDFYLSIAAMSTVHPLAKRDLPLKNSMQIAKTENINENDRNFISYS
jgi:hypothetical protein